MGCQRIPTPKNDNRRCELTKGKGDAEKKLNSETDWAARLSFPTIHYAIFLVQKANITATSRAESSLTPSPTAAAS